MVAVPTYQRKSIRQAVGLRRLYDCYVGTTNTAVASGAAVVLQNPYHPYLNDPSASGQNALQRAYLRVGSTDYRVASVNFGSGAVVTAQNAGQPVASGADFEIHTRLSVPDLDNCLNQTIDRLRIRQEVAIPTVDGALFYTIDGAASPNSIMDVLDVWYYANPANSQNRDRRDPAHQWVVALTATGRELRIPAPGLTMSQQIVMDCMLQLTLGADDAATINLPDWQDEQAVLSGAAMYAYDLLVNRAPGQESGLFEQRRKEHSISFTRFMSKQIDDQDVDLGFSSDWEHRFPTDAGI